MNARSERAEFGAREEGEFVEKELNKFGPHDEEERGGLADERLHKAGAGEHRKPKVVIITLTKSGGMIREKKENERSDES